MSPRVDKIPIVTCNTKIAVSLRYFAAQEWANARAARKSNRGVCWCQRSDHMQGPLLQRNLNAAGDQSFERAMRSSNGPTSTAAAMKPKSRIKLTKKPPTV